ncbi:unnamed protein product [Larinioides sclopetarius]|uniref:Uncharacterized protein n=1 Tax=Larinioides sclopetarius TaxID=280406 RepID=A0AAV2AA08_9ARAC
MTTRHCSMFKVCLFGILIRSNNTGISLKGGSRIAKGKN